ncbi:extracellular solute-binding protein [Humibacter sp. RRB41]|uniref:sugar ABC transporter substrate-binding protein n=1 Tax=Humibacter sp. RRB41 TaxID=2919946 RepID=UPI001FAA1798|nr:extracellular solute-binding protein [Humibacter sp. RRB41]
MQRRTRWLASGALAVATALALSACGSGFSGSSSTSTSGALTSSKKPLTVLIGSSGPAETKAVTSAVGDWSKSSGTDAKVLAANNLDQQLAQGFAAKKPADVFYLSTGALAGYASNGDLLSYGSMLSNKSDFYPSLVKSFTYNGQLYCAPKDFSTLQLVINTDMWKAAGLTSSDYPKTWDQLEAVAKKLTTSSHVGLSMNGQYERMGAFMVQAGGNLMNADSTKATANSAANVSALTYLKKLLNEGVMKTAKDLGQGDGGQALGTGQAAMTVEGNWVQGELSNDYPNVKYTVVQLPAGKAGMGTLQFSNCWGIAADSPNQKAALKLVEQLTTKQDQLAFSKAFGVMPSIKSAASEWKSENPASAAFLEGASYAQGVPTAKGSADVVTNLDSQLESLATSDPKTLLDQTQKNLQALLK